MAPVNEPRFVLIGSVPTSSQSLPAPQTLRGNPNGPQQQPGVVGIVPRKASALVSSYSSSATPPPPPPPPPPSLASSPPEPSKIQPGDVLSDNMPPKKKKGTAATSGATAATTAAAAAAAKRPTAARGRTSGGPAKSKKSKKAAAAAAAAASRKLKKTAGSHSRGNEENVDPEQQQQQQQKQKQQETNSEEEEDNGPYCVCRGPDDHTFMIACELCDEWFHGRCVNLEKDVGETLVSRFICSPCQARTGHKTQYLLTCSHDNCRKPARLYATPVELEGKAVPLQGDDVVRRSGFCSDEHRDAWWSKLLRKVPPRAERDAGSSAGGRGLAREEILALLAGRLNVLDGQGDWKLLKQPFSADDACEDRMLTDEETRILGASQREREAMADDLKLSQSMLRLLEMAYHRRRAAINAKLLNEDQCGYDARLSSVGAKAAFRIFVNSLEGAAIFEQDKLGDPALPPLTASTSTTHTLATSNATTTATDDATPEDVIMANDDTSDSANPVSTKGMCDRKRCKAHHGWYRLLSRTVKMQMREMRAATETRLAREGEVRSAAVGRTRRMAVDPGEVVLEGVAAGA